MVLSAWPNPRCTGESPLHRAMKAIVRNDLARERYAVIEEAQLPPDARISWRSYRPDLVGYRSEDGNEELVLVECETRPNMRRLKAKKSGTVSFQPFLFKHGSVRRILAVPQGKLRSVDLKIRETWEIWVIGSVSTLQTIPPMRRPA